MRLSQQRADSVVSALITQGVDASRVRTQGLGPANPIASNSTAEGVKTDSGVYDDYYC